ncbi:MAG: hypothetical protein Q9191_003968, partial [Dirinaria sp. TL-2023a]
MDASATAAGWLSFIATAVGLGSLITQASAIEERLDPFYSSRTPEHLGSWYRRQPRKPWHRLRKEPPIGPVISASLKDGFCGHAIVDISQIPLQKPGKASWTSMLSMVHETNEWQSPKYRNWLANVKPRFAIEDAERVRLNSMKYAEEPNYNYDLPPPWDTLPTQYLCRNGSSCYIGISRTSLITLLAMVNGRVMYHYSEASGHRAAYASYCGHFYINWPLGQEAVVTHFPHDAHVCATDIYPLKFQVRVAKCVEMLTGVITSSDGQSFKCGFPGRKAPGTWILQYQRKSFAGAHGARHLYNLMGGNIFDVDYLHARMYQKDSDSPAKSECVLLELPSRETNKTVTLYVPKQEEEIIVYSLDCLPWSALSWSMHRGLRDILLAYGKPTMDKFRPVLASALYSAVQQHHDQLQAKGWSSAFFERMADLASNSVLAGDGNSGDSVRVVTDAALLLWQSSNPAQLDETVFWREGRHGMMPDIPLDIDGILALTKFFVIEWSQELDYQ